MERDCVCDEKNICCYHHDKLLNSKLRETVIKYMHRKLRELKNER